MTYILSIDDLRKSRGPHSVRAFGHGPVSYRSMPAGIAQSRHAFVGSTVSMWGRWQIPVNKRQNGHQKCRSNTHCSRGMCRADSRFPQFESAVNTPTDVDIVTHLLVTVEDAFLGGVGDGWWGGRLGGWCTGVYRQWLELFPVQSAAERCSAVWSWQWLRILIGGRSGTWWCRLWEISGLAVYWWNRGHLPVKVDQQVRAIWPCVGVRIAATAQFLLARTRAATVSFIN